LFLGDTIEFLILPLYLVFTTIYTRKYYKNCMSSNTIKPEEKEEEEEEEVKFSNKDNSQNTIKLEKEEV
jgi:hypothetical protein